MLRSCSRCGKIHEVGFKCITIKRKYVGGNERKLRSKHKWTDKSLEIRDNAHYLCEVCKDEGTLTYNDLEVHHIEKVTDSPELLLENNNLICLCQFHHKLADAGQLDKAYLKRLAGQRENSAEVLTGTE